MATRNVYITYKRDTSQLLYWIIRTSNGIIKSAAALGGNYEAMKVNITGEITVKGLVALSHLIAEHLSYVPPEVFRLFRAVIGARTSTHEAFQQVVAEHPDPDIEKSNRAHKHFIDALIEAFNVLRGKDWRPESSTDGDGANVDAEASHLKDDLDRLLLSNRFGALNLDNTVSDDEGAAGSDPDVTADWQPGPEHAPQGGRQAGLCKGSKSKRVKKFSKQQKATLSKESVLSSLPLESYRIIEETEGVSPDYYIAVYGIMWEWIDLRTYLQNSWRECAYNGLNTAVAAGISHVAIAMIQRSAADIFVDFPGQDAYETILHAITGGNPEKTQGQSSFKVTIAQTLQAMFSDVQEDLMIYAYHNLIDFLEDFQKSRSGKPTKRMLAQIRDWDPDFNLQTATDEERIRWRRSYTINWLYDLVNLFSSVVLRSNTTEGGAHALEKIDWSPTGPWSTHRSIFGLSEFASFVTSLAMQKQGTTDIRKRILPHHVFQLQCIVDSLMVTRGWSLSRSRGHVLKPPPENFRPLRDVDLFRDWKNERPGNGILHPLGTLKRLCAKNATDYGERLLQEDTDAMLSRFSREYQCWLGESPYKVGNIPWIPTSRFSNTNPNGLWEYSPFLCGAGLMGSLELAYLGGMAIWQRTPEPMLLMHLHNMLVKKGYLETPDPLFQSLQSFFTEGFFLRGKVPSSKFPAALKARLQFGDARGRGKPQHPAPNPTDEDYDFHSVLDVQNNHFFNKPSNLSLYRQANWNIAAIPDDDVPLQSTLFMLRIAETKRTSDPTTHLVRYDNTPLVKRARAAGMTDEDIQNFDLATSCKIDIDRDHNPRGGPWTSRLERELLLGFAKTDLMMNISGRGRPLSSFNYVAVTCTMMIMFEEMEKELAERRNKMYVRVYENASLPAQTRRTGLVYLAMAEVGDEECLKVMVRVFERFRSEFGAYIYWDNLVDVVEYVTKVGYEELEEHPGRDNFSAM